MKFGKYGVFTFTDVMGPADLAALAQRVEALGYSTLWYPEAFNYETFALGAYLLSHSKSLIVASGIANIYARDPAASVMGHNSLNALYGGRFVLGLGVSHAPLVADVRGHEYKQPVATMRRYLDDMDRAWKALGQDKVAKQLVLAALGPNMSTLAAERTLGSFPYNITPAQAAVSRAQMGPKAAVMAPKRLRPSGTERDATSTCSGVASSSARASSKRARPATTGSPSGAGRTARATAASRVRVAARAASRGVRAASSTERSRSSTPRVTAAST